MSASEIIENAEAIISIDARGFIFGSAISLQASKPMVVARKPGKLPGELHEESYSLEYGKNSLSIQKKAISKFNSYAIVDDLLATGGTVNCISKILKSFPGSFPGFLATIIGFEACKDIAEPKIKPLASIEIIASAFFIIWLEDIFKISSLNIFGSWIIPRTSLNSIPFLG